MSQPHRIRFAQQLTAAADGASWSTLARRAEADGYDVISLPDHLGEQFAPLPALAAAAAVTTEIRLGMFVLANDFRHPALLAKEAATLDVISDGRVELGIGAGWDEAEYRSLGLAFDPAGVRLERLEESIGVLRSLFGGDPVTTAGGHYRLDDFALRPRPRQSTVPIVVGGGGRRVLGLAARTADTVSIATNNRHRRGPGLEPGSISAEAVAQQLGWIPRDAAGARFGALELNIRILASAVGGDRVAEAESLAPSLGLSAAELLSSPFALLGTEGQIVEQLLATREHLGISYFTVSQRHAPALVPVVAALRGA